MGSADGGAVKRWALGSRWLTALLVAALFCSPSETLLGPVSPSTALAAPVKSSDMSVGGGQQVDQPPIEQVGEGSGDDVETLDNGESATGESVSPDQENLDNESAAIVENTDSEQLDQGEATAPADAVTAPVATTYVAPAAAPAADYVAPEPIPHYGPVIPAGFGTGRVQVAAGRSGFPAGLVDCHVGAVTGRAYAGIDCGEGSSFAGHASSFQDFPFFPDAGFPFEGDESFIVAGDGFPFGEAEEPTVAIARADSDENGVAVSTRQRTRRSGVEDPASSLSDSSGANSVELTQRTHERDGRSRGGNRGANRGKDADNNGRDSSSTADESFIAENPDPESSDVTSQQQAQQDTLVTADGKEKKSKNKKGSKKSRQRTKNRNR